MLVKEANVPLGSAFIFAPPARLVAKKLMVAPA